MKSSNNSDLFYLEKTLTYVLIKFLNKIKNEKPLIRSSLTSKLEFPVENYTNLDELYKQFQKQFVNNFQILQNTDYFLENHNRNSLNKFSADILINEYFKSFLSYDNRSHSIYSKHIRNLIKNYENDNLKNSIKTLSFKIWNEINKNFISSNFDYLFYIFKYVFNHLKAMQIVVTKESNYHCFDEMFNEGLVQMVNFMNNLIYYYRHDFQKDILKGITVENFKFLLKLIIKLNEYIIGIADFFDNSTLFSLSEKYFIFMDFFILICEESDSGELDQFFFEDFDENEEKKNYKKNQYNFYYQSFIQLRKIITLINVGKIGSFSFGSFRLIAQFLYLTRFLKELLEDDITDENKKFSEIINECFEEIFDLNWLISKNIKNDEYSYILRFELLYLFNSYIEEHSSNLSDKFYKKINQFFDNHEIIFEEICSCFDIVIEYIRNTNDDNNLLRNENFTLEKLKTFYLNNEDSLYKNKYFELAELYYKFLRLLDPFYQSLKEEYDDKSNIQNNDQVNFLNYQSQIIRTNTNKNLNNFLNDDKKE